MRLTCPNCDAEYEVDDSMIPPGGRDVQCSNCETTWFQTDPEKVSETPGLEAESTFPDGVGAAAVAAARGAQQRSALDPDALAVIEEEVAFETEARQAEETDTPDATTKTDDADDVTAHIKELEKEELQELEKPSDSAPVVDDPNTKGDRLPDVEEINSTLASAPDPVDEEDAGPVVDTMPARKARGFRLGFGFMLLIAAALLMIYAYAPQLAERFPDMTERLAKYVATVDRGRVWLDITASGLVDQINGLIGKLTGEA